MENVLYSGIVLDTKNFAVQTGERTFEAAALLRRSGADLESGTSALQGRYVFCADSCKIGC